MKTRDAAQAVMSWSFNEAMAVINAFYNTPERMEMLGIGADYNKSCTDGIEIEGKTLSIRKKV